MSLNVFVSHSDAEEGASRSTVGSPEIPALPDSSPVDAQVSSSVSATVESFRRMREALVTARLRARELTSYTAVLEIQEEVNGNLREMDRIQVKFRQQPFSVYMRWSTNGQEALFVEGRNGDRLLAKPANGLAALKRLWRLDPDSRLAKQSCRYPITQSGIERLVDRVHAFYAARDDWSSAVNCSISRSNNMETVATEYCIQFRDRSVSPDYPESRLTFDEATGLLVAVQNFGWTDQSPPRIVEYYVYRSINRTAVLSDTDFDETNSDYEFVAR